MAFCPDQIHFITRPSSLIFNKASKAGQMCHRLPQFLAREDFDDPIGQRSFRSRHCHFLSTPEFSLVDCSESSSFAPEGLPEVRAGRRFALSNHHYPMNRFLNHQDITSMDNLRPSSFGNEFGFSQNQSLRKSSLVLVINLFNHLPPNFPIFFEANKSNFPFTHRTKHHVFESSDFLVFVENFALC